MSLSDDQAARSELHFKYLELASKFIVPITVVAVSVIGGGYLRDFFAERERQASRNALLAEFIARREEADTQLRKDMYTQALALSDRASETNPTESVRALELLVRNFHDVLDLRVLMRGIVNQVRTAETLGMGEKLVLEDRIFDLAENIASKEMNALLGGLVARGNLAEFDLFAEGGLPYSAQPLQIGDLTINLVFWTYIESEERFIYTYFIEKDGAPVAMGSYVVDPFVFPMTHNIRLGNSQRGALVMREKGTFVDDQDAIRRFYKFSFLVFPEAHANLKDRPLVEDIIENILDFGNKASEVGN